MHFSLRLIITPGILLLSTALACGPKVDGDEGGDESSASTTGDELTTSGGGNSDPSSPGTSPASGTEGTTVSSSASTVSSSSDDTSGDPSGDPATTTLPGTSVGTSETDPTSDPSDTDTPIDPPQPCGDGDPIALEFPTALAYLESQVPPAPDPTGGSSGTSSTSGGEPTDPSTLYLRLSDQKFVCEDPEALLACGPHWDVTIVIPPEFQFPGLYNLLGPDIRGFGSESSADEGNNECGFGVGTLEGSLEILAIDETGVQARLCHVKDFFGPETDPELEGVFTAPRCK